MTRSFFRFAIIAVFLACLFPAGALAQSYGGSLETANCSTISGWAWDGTQPNTPINVDIYDGSIPVATVLAGNYRADLVALGYGNGYHGFSFTVPASLKNNAIHYIIVYYGGTTFVLPNSGASINCAPTSTGYQYYYSDTFNSINSTNWWQNGTLSTGASGLTSSTTNGGSLISKVAVPDGTSQYEVKATLALKASGGTYDLYLRADSGALSGPGATGTYYALELQNPTFTGSACSATLALYKESAGVVTNIVNTSVTCHDGMTIRLAYSFSNQIIAFIDSKYYVMWAQDATIASGQPGIGVRGAPSTNGVTEVDFGPLDRIAPPAINPQLISTSPYPNRVDMQWSGVADDPNGTGVAFYVFFRNGTLVSGIQTTTFSDLAVVPGTAYSDTLAVCDFALNCTYTGFSVTTPPPGAIEVRETGVRPLGSYWGGNGEQIDLRSGNLNYTIPLVKPQGRGGWGVGFNLSYNSQNWKQDPSATWQYGRDVGYGYGWRLQAGSLTPIYQDYWTVHHYLFIDSTGAEYKLDQNSGGVWSSLEGIYISYDANVGKLYFNDGSFWLFGSQSAGGEQDTGTMYPTQMQDSNGNQILIRYYAGQGITWTNSSARIQQIEDVRAYSWGGQIPTTYNFNFTTEPIPHLSSIVNYVATSENYTFTYASYGLSSPFAPASYGTFSTLQSSKLTNLNLSTTFTYDTSGGASTGTGELTQVTTPYGGFLRWDYVNSTLAGSRTLREVQDRFLSMSPGAALTAHGLYRDSQDTGRSVHLYANLFDWNGNSNKVWWFMTDTTSFKASLVTAYEERNYPSEVPLFHQDFDWSATPTSNNAYISGVTTKLDPGQSYQAIKKTTQTLDQYGNLLTQQIYNFGNLTIPARTYTNTYLTDDSCTQGHHPCGSNYAARHIFNRLVSSVLTDGTNTTTLAQNTYDYATLNDVAGVREHDPNLSISNLFRGNPYSSATPSASKYFSTYDIGGNLVTNQNNGVPASVTMDSSKNWAVPSAVTTGTLTSNLGWNTTLNLTSATGPNTDTASIAYDSNARPQSSTSPFGATTTYTYNDAATPPIKTATTNGHWVKTSMDGFGRTVKTETGYGTTTVSVVDTQYAPCGCSSLGKLSQVSQPHAPSATQYWSKYTYDGSGRTLSLLAPDGASTIVYLYQGNTVKATDAAGKWKLFTMDAFGNLTTVQEPDPTLGTVTTTYAYDVLNHLIQVTMPRGSNTQYRYFNYTNNTTHVTGKFLLSATNPENGLVTFTYNLDNTLATKTDAKGQVLTYSYDGYKRVTQINVNGNMIRTFSYDTNPYDGSFSHYTAGRLTAVQNAAIATGASSPSQVQFYEMFSYTAPGQMTKKRLQINQSIGGGNHVLNLDGTYTYDNEGKMTSVNYPTTWQWTGTSWTSTAGPTYSYSFDSMSRPIGLTDQTNYAAVSGVQYGGTNTYDPNALTAMSYFGVNETRMYNNMGQMTRMTVGTIAASQLDITYTFPSAGGNAGKINSQTDNVTGEVVSYTYDSLNRIANAAGSGWTQSFGYDGFGNLVSKTGTNSPSLSIAVDPNNHIVGQYYDANGNQGLFFTYDSENRLVSPGISGLQYAYDSKHKRIWRGVTDGDGNMTSQEVYFYGADGQKLGTYAMTISGGQLQDSDSDLAVFFQTKRVGLNGSAFVQDRLGSKGKYFPYGEERNSPPLPNDQVKYATYIRDSATGLDYAADDTSYYGSNYGNYLTPLRGRFQGDRTDPLSWNRYRFEGGDPINNITDISECLIENPECLPYDPAPFACPTGTHDDGEGDCIPDPAVADPVRCDLSLATRGTPRNGQDLVGLAASTPSENTLGDYTTVSGKPYTLERSYHEGWFFAVQLQGNLQGDTNTLDWVITQTSFITGTGSRIDFDNNFIPDVPFSLFSVDDSPKAIGAVFRGDGMIDWLDAPGLLKYNLVGTMWVAGSFDYYFRSSLLNILTGDFCTVKWRMHLEFIGDEFTASVSVVE